jgi:hypothetical protein
VEVAGGNPLSRTAPVCRTSFRQRFLPSQRGVSDRDTSFFSDNVKRELVNGCRYRMLMSDCVNQGLGITSMKPMPWLASFWVTPLGTEVVMILAFVTTRVYRPAAMASSAS